MATEQLDISLNVVASTCAAYNLRRTMRTVNQHYDAFIRESGLRATQFTLIAAVKMEGPVPISQLADTLAMDRTTLTRNLKPLERDGLIRLEAGTDRRTRIVEITADGESVLATALPLWQQAQSSIVDNWGQTRFEHLLDELTELESLSSHLS